MSYSLHQDVFSGMYYTTLLGGEFDNCHGQGKTPGDAVDSLKLLLICKRRKQKRFAGE